MTSKQRAYLRGLANDLQPVVQVGKEGVTEGVTASAEDQLEAHELIKGGVTRGCPVGSREALEALCEALSAEPVQAIGSKFVLYRPSREKPPQIVLPK